MPPAATLSPLAIPFMPSRPGYEEYASFGAIYNDGIPEGIVVGDHADHEIIHNIPDVAIDEIFPPTAAEAAELDALDDFLAAMVNLSFLEEHEEKTRSNIGHSFKKRWEARRKDGLKSSLHGAHSTIVHSSRGMANTNMNERRIAHFHRYRHANENAKDKRHNILDMARKVQIQNRYERNRNGSNCAGRSRPIQQPRKMNCRNVKGLPTF